MIASSFLEHLNQQQRQAVEQDTGTLLVIAGAGSGKTRVITSRIVNLLVNKQAPAHSILALTFTNKAAQEMKERIERALPQTSAFPFLGTFHSYCLRLLKQNSHLLEHPFISIMDEDDQQKLLQGIITRANLTKQVSAKQLAYHISHIKNHFDDALYQEWIRKNPLLEEVYTLYEQEKRNSKAVDFDDLLLETVKLFKQHPTFRERFQDTIKHILVDEYQDTNTVQHELLKLMTLDHNGTQVCTSICVVGDEDQSIYSWRGATVANMVNFNRDFPDTRVIKIEQNYRSVQPILQAANSIIVHNRNRHPKELWSNKQAQNRIVHLQCISDYHEADMIAVTLKAVASQHSDYSRAVLYRTHFQSRALEEGLLKQGIPYKIIGGVQFYERKEIKDLLAYLKLVINPHDRTSFFRVINCPSRGLGAKFEEQFQTLWLEHPHLTFAQVSTLMLEQHPLTKNKQSTLQEFLSIFTQCNEQTSPTRALDIILNQTEYRAHIKESFEPEEALSRLENIKELLRAVHFFETEKKIFTITTLLDEIALMQAQYDSNSDTSNPVLLMSLHAAKGLEFDFVVLPGLEEGLLPSSRSLLSDDSVEEERRLLYVGITRARHYLLITNSRFRYTYGSMTEQKQSRFLKELPPYLLTAQDCAYWKESQAALFCSQWMNTTHVKSATTSSAHVPKKQSLTTTTTVSKTGAWKKNQPVSHPTFGVGVIKEIEEKNDGTFTLTITFKVGTKKIASSFVSIV